MNGLSNNNGDWILEGFFDPYLQSMNTPNHLQKRTYERLIEAFLLQLANLGYQRYLEVAIGEELENVDHVCRIRLQRQGQKAKHINDK